jgi:recombination protein RecR
MEITGNAHAELVRELTRLPGIGAKSAGRLAYHLLRLPEGEVRRFAETLLSCRGRIRRCGVCNALADADPCRICSDPGRDGSILCVVEQPQDLVVIERTGEYRGRYHVLGGALSPLKGIGPEEIDTVGLERRVREGGIREVILATNPNVEGEATALFLSRRLKGPDVRVTRIAFGLPVGSELDWADDVTVSRSLGGRREL